MREFFTIAIFKIKADIRMNKTTLNSQKEKHSILSLRRATSVALPGLRLHLNFYPRSPCGERHGPLCNAHPLLAFLSTLSLRRATCIVFPKRHAIGISIHALLAESDALKPQEAFTARISIHALLAESDKEKRPAQMLGMTFLSTLSLRRATDDWWTYAEAWEISIHALLAESDSAGKEHAGGRNISIHALLAESDTAQGGRFHTSRRISIHALLAESDSV